MCLVEEGILVYTGFLPLAQVGNINQVTISARGPRWAQSRRLGSKSAFPEATLPGQIPAPSTPSWLTLENREAPEGPGSPQAGPLRQAWGSRHPLQNPRLRPRSPRPRGSRSPRGPAWRPPHLSTPRSPIPDVPADPRDHCSPRCPRDRSCHATPPSPSQPRSPGRRDGRPSPPGSSQTFCPGRKEPIPP